MCIHTSVVLSYIHYFLSLFLLFSLYKYYIIYILYITFLHLVYCGPYSIFFKNCLPFHVWLYCSLFTRSLIDEHLGCFQYFVSMNKSTLRPSRHAWFHIDGGVSPRCIPRSGITGAKSKHDCLALAGFPPRGTVPFWTLKYVFLHSSTDPFLSKMDFCQSKWEITIVALFYFSFLKLPERLTIYSYVWGLLVLVYFFYKLYPCLLSIFSLFFFSSYILGILYRRAICITSW